MTTEANCPECGALACGNKPGTFECGSRWWARTIFAEEESLLRTANCQHRAQIAKLTAERDRYRKALESIIARCHHDKSVQIARAALEGDAQTPTPP